MKDGKDFSSEATPSSFFSARNEAHIRRAALHCLRTVATGIGVICSIALLALLTYLAWLLPSVPSMQALRAVRIDAPSELLAADGSHLATLKRVQQEAVTIDRISPHVVDALIATEDRRFYEHRGVDLRRTAAAVFHTLSGDDQGGSTITQQLARNLFPEEIGRSRSIHRKAKEIITALKLERLYSKAQILEMYLNTVPFLYNTFGIEMAARTYFNKSARELDVVESATLVAMLKGTKYYNPITNPARALKRRNLVLAQMTRYHMLPPLELAQLSELPITARLNRQTETPGVNGHFIAHVRKWLADWAEEHGYDPYADGLIIHTTLDPALQELAASAVERQANFLQKVANVEWGRSPVLSAASAEAYRNLHEQVEPFRHLWDTQPELVETFIRESPEFRKAVDKGESDDDALARLTDNADYMRRLLGDKSRLEAGMVVIDPDSGAVKAWIGSRDFQRDQFDHVAQALRQPGSTFKPFVYGAALEMGFSPSRTYKGGPIKIRLADGGIWQPTDMGGSQGPMTLRQGLTFSKNTITAQVMQDVGANNVIALAQAMGVRHSRLEPVASLALGTSPVTLLEMTSAYTTIANVGKYRPPLFVQRITDRNGKVIAEFDPLPAERALSEPAAIELIDILRAAVSQGTGKDLKRQFGISADVAGKTGTTQYNTDGWFILMHPQLVAGAWVGFNDQRITMRSNYWGQGGHNAILLVGDLFRALIKQHYIDGRARFPQPPHMPDMVAMQDPYPAVSSTTEAQTKSPEGDGTMRDLPPPGHGIIVRRSHNGSTLIGDERGIEILGQGEQVSSPNTSRSSAELARILSGMGRDPMSGARSEGGLSPASGFGAD